MARSVWTIRKMMVLVAAVAVGLSLGLSVLTEARRLWRLSFYYQQRAQEYAALENVSLSYAKYWDAVERNERRMADEYKAGRIPKGADSSVVSAMNILSNKSDLVNSLIKLSIERADKSEVLKRENINEVKYYRYLKKMYYNASIRPWRPVPRGKERERN